MEQLQTHSLFIPHGIPFLDYPGGSAQSERGA
jgi:hypothetical protein